MRELIKKMMVEFYKTCSVDRYGQVGVVTPYEVFKDKKNDVLEYLKTNKIINIKTYGSSFGNYKGFSLDYDVLDNDIKSLCYKAIRENQNYKNSMTR